MPNRDINDLNADLLGIVENSFDGMCIADGDGRILMLNPAIEKVTGLRNADLLGRNIDEAVGKGLISQSAVHLAIEEATNVSAC